MSQTKKQAAGLALALGLVLSASTSPVYGNPTNSIGPSGDTTRAAAPLTAMAAAACKAMYLLYRLAPAKEISVGSTSNPAPATYPGNVLDR